MPSKANQAAKEIWEQVFARLAETDDAAVVDPDYDPAADEAKALQALKEAGWSDETIAKRMELHKAERASAPITSPGVNPHVEAHLARLCDDVEEAMDRLKLGSHAKVARGVEPRAWAYASKINVVMTDESVVTVSAFLFRFCGLIARAFTRTLMLNPYVWESKRFSEQEIHGYFRAAPEILRYWMQIYVSFALTGTHVFVPYKPARATEVMLFEQVARAMEIFVIAHEYGHHHFAHGKSLDADPHLEEFEADQFALRISGELERTPLFFENPYLLSGAGGVVMLLALETLKEIASILGRKQRHAMGTHPAVDARIARFDSVAVLEPREFERLKNFRMAAARVMRSANAALLPALKALPVETFRRVFAMADGSRMPI